MQEALINFAAPTLAGLKSGNIFTYCGRDIENQVRMCNDNFNPLGIFIEPLAFNSNGALIYVYRATALEKDLCQPAVAEFMAQYGYNEMSVKTAIERLKNRIEAVSDFPHEIGCFLSYPIEDVKGFIENKGKNYIFNGYWKVYSNEEKARKNFFRYKHCTDIYNKMFLKGTPIEKLIVAIH